MKENFPKVDFIGIGAQKAATTWIFKCLAEHPQVGVSDPKETNFFSDFESFNKGADYYCSFFNDCIGAEIIGEFSPQYLLSENVAERIFNIYPDVKLIVSLRNPVERVLSAYCHYRSKKRYSDLNFKEAIKIFPDIIKRGLYYQHLIRYYKLFPENNILVVLYDDIKKNPEEVIRRIYEFLEVDTGYRPVGLNFKINTSQARFSKINKFINKQYLKHRKKFFGNIIINIFRRLGFNKYLLDMIFKNSDNYKDPGIGDLGCLKDCYKEDIEKLEVLIKRDLTFWK